MGWQRRGVARALVVTIFVAYLVIQIAVPVSRLGTSSPTRLGWQMFSTRAPAPEFVVVSVSGQAQPIDLDDYVAFPRADLPLVSELPPHLCLVVPDAERVEVGSEVFVCP